MGVGKWKGGVTAKEVVAKVRFPKHHGSGILTLHIAPSPRSSKGLFLEYTVGNGPQGDLRTFFIPHNHLEH